nr:MAG TPA: hypothetical protein [Bacteriophage sp.]
MRIISQDGSIDFPYENSCVFIFPLITPKLFTIRIQMVGDTDTITQIATYSTEEKALKAMEMLRKAYVSMPIIFQNVEITEDVVKQFEKLKKSGIISRTMNNEPSKVEYVNNCIFQFPKDDEIEVET